MLERVKAPSFVEGTETRAIEVERQDLLCGRGRGQGRWDWCRRGGGGGDGGRRGNRRRQIWEIARDVALFLGFFDRLANESGDGPERFEIFDAVWRWDIGSGQGAIAGIAETEVLAGGDAIQKGVDEGRAVYVERRRIERIGGDAKCQEFTIFVILGGERIVIEGGKGGGLLQDCTEC